MSLTTRIVDAASAAMDAAATSWAKRTPKAEGTLAIPPPYQERDPALLGNRLTPTVLAQIIRQRNEGAFQPWVDLGAEFLSGKNPHLLTQLGVRRASVLETKFDIRPGTGSNQRGATKAANDFRALLARWRASQQWDRTIAQVVQGEWWGRSLHELLWSDDAGFMAPEGVAWVHNRRLSYACPIDDPEPWTIRIHDPDDPRSQFYGSGLYGVPITRWHPDKFILQECTPLGVHTTGEGLFAGVIWYLLIYEWDWRDLVSLIELLGRPGHIGYYAAGGAKDATRGSGANAKFDGARNATREEVAALERVMSQIAGSLRATLPDTTHVDPLKYDNRASPLQLEVAKHIEGLLSKAISGTTGVTDIVAGARAAHDVAWRQSLTYWRYDVRRVSAWLMDVAARMVRANPGRYGLNCPSPEVFSPEVEAPDPSTAKPAEKTGDTPPKDAP